MPTKWVLCAWLLLSVAAPCLASGGEDDWIPVTPQDLQLKEVPGNPGASAVQLYYAHRVDYTNGKGEFFYHRIKILSDAGKKYGDVEVIGLSRTVKDLKARLVRPDGTIIDFKDKPFEKTVVKTRGYKVKAKALTLPEVTVGSIVEYKYWLRGDEYYVYDTEWIIEHDLFTVKEQFSFKYSGNNELVYVTSPGVPRQPSVPKRGVAELELENVPAFRAEEHMPPEENYKMQVRFFFAKETRGSPDRYWQELGKMLATKIEMFGGNHKEVREAAAEAVGTETDPEKRLRKLYDRAQQIRNLSYERTRTEVEQDKDKIKANENVADVLKHGYGTRRDITQLFAAMAKASGFDAAVLPVSSRRERFFEKSILSAAQVNSEVVGVQLNGKEIFLDPGTRFCPFGLIRWMNTATTALRTDKNGGTLVTIPSTAPAKAITARTAVLKLADDGGLSGEITVEFKAGEALEHRLEALQTDEAGRNKDLEDEVRAWLPSGATAKLSDSQGWEGTDTPLTARVHVEVPTFASMAGKRVLMPAYVFQQPQQYRLTGSSRKYPVYFPYPFAETDKVTITVPQGYTVENLPKQADVKSEFARYQNSSQWNAGTLVTQRVLVMGGTYFDVPAYPALKDFLGKVLGSDQEQAVFLSPNSN